MTIFIVIKHRFFLAFKVFNCPMIYWKIVYIDSIGSKSPLSREEEKNAHKARKLKLRKVFGNLLHLLSLLNRNNHAHIQISHVQFIPFNGWNQSIVPFHNKTQKNQKKKTETERKTTENREKSVNEIDSKQCNWLHCCHLYICSQVEEKKKRRKTNRSKLFLFVM